MTQKLIAIILSVMIAVCGCGTAQNSAGSASGQNTATTAATAAPGSSETAEKAASRIAYRYASRSEGQELMLGNKAYFDGFSRNDLEYKMQKKGATIEEYKAHAAEQVLDFTGEEVKAVDAVFAEMEKSLGDNGYTLPPLGEIVLIKTTMQEEPGASAYTHGTQIYLSPRLLDFLMADQANKHVITYMEHVLWHETFHCLTRCNPDFRAAMYKLIHFTVQEEDFPLPPSAFEYHISNPDVEHHNAYATFRINGQDIDCFTDLITTQHFEKEGDLFFACETTALIPIDGSDMYYTLGQAENFKEVFGANTAYVIDPEECMADNFSYALTYGMEGPAGGGYPNPEIIEGIMALLK